jgi:hypothetical protein
MSEAAPQYNSDYVNTMDYFIDYYANHDENLKEFDYHNFFNSNAVSNENCYIEIKVDNSMSLYFIKGGRYSIPIGVECFYQFNNWGEETNMALESQRKSQELIEGKEDITHVYDDILAEYERDRIEQNTDIVPVSTVEPSVSTPQETDDSWGPPPLATLVRSEPVIDYSILDDYAIPADVVFSTGMDNVNRQLSFDDDSDDEMPDLITDMDDLTNRIIDEIRNTNIIKCPLCRAENSKEQCVDIKGSGDTCSICLEATVEVFFIGCAHAVTCKSCYQRLLNV